MKFDRASGILLHPTSLPGNFGSGDLGASAYHFVDWLKTAGQSLWQMLPVGPIGLGNSPYMSLSAFAGNPLLIDLQELVERGWLIENELSFTQGSSSHRIDFSKIITFRLDKLEKASDCFFAEASSEDKNDFEAFCYSAKYWLEEYALFQALNIFYEGSEWTEWAKDIIVRKQSAIKSISEEMRKHILTQKFIQWRFDCQWKRLKKYATERGVRLIGDIPIFVAHHSADVWMNSELFYLDEEGQPIVVAGVPPDYFSETGQRWGNPLYNWELMEAKKYQWWIARFKRMFEMFDIVRIDHFRGFESYWEIPGNEELAINGKWQKGPGGNFFKSVQRKLGRLPIIAEDLGIITPEVALLREKTGFPGMKVLQFAFSDGVNNAYLPHNYINNCVVYTGTHDNDTTCGWYEKATEHERDFVRRYCKVNGHEINWDLIKLALQSIADLAVIPFQDVIGLGSEARMNFPSTVEGNWEWRFTWEQVGPEPASRLYELTALYGRCNAERMNLIY